MVLPRIAAGLPKRSLIHTGCRGSGSPGWRRADPAEAEKRSFTWSAMTQPRLRNCGRRAFAQVEAHGLAAFHLHGHRLRDSPAMPAGPGAGSGRPESEPVSRTMPVSSIGPGKVKVSSPIRLGTLADEGPGRGLVAVEEPLGLPVPGRAPRGRRRLSPRQGRSQRRPSAAGAAGAEEQEGHGAEDEGEEDEDAREIGRGTWPGAPADSGDPRRACR